MASVASARLFKWHTPVYEPWFGKNKTWRGIIFGTIIGLLVYYLQSLLNTGLEYHNYASFLLGFLLSFGAVFGDLVESFFKRRVGLKPGQSWIPFDQIDHVFIALLLALFVIDIGLWFFLIALILTFFLHILVNFLSYKVGIRKSLW